MARHFQKKAADAGKPDADEVWTPVVAELDETSKRLADRADAIVPKK